MAEGDGSTSSSELEFTLTGVLDRAAAQALLQQVRGAKKSVGGTTLLDVRELERCDPQARSLLVEAQKLLGAHSCRTAWLVSRPITHGLAMWVINLSGDGGARAVTSLAQALEWLQGEEERAAANTEQLVGAVAGVRRWRSI